MSSYCVLFIKQKTAYEMRISDWSSDVCSSDLTLIEAFISAEDKTFFSHGGLDYPGIVSAVIDNLTSNKRPRGASTITQQVAKNLQIGRASCRERVCQYV